MADAPARDYAHPDDEEIVWPPPNETARERAARLERQRIMIEEAREDIRQGRCLSGDEAMNWLRRSARGEPVEIPFQD